MNENDHYLFLQSYRKYLYVYMKYIYGECMAMLASVNDIFCAIIEFPQKQIYIFYF